MGATTHFLLLRCPFLRQQSYSWGWGWFCSRIAHPMDNAAAGHGFPVLSHAICFSSALAWHQFLFLVGELLKLSKLGSLQQFYPLRNDQGNQDENRALSSWRISLSFSLRSAACPCILYTAPECILNSLEVGHFCRALRLFFLYSVRQRKPLLHCSMPALNQHCCFLWEIKQRFISPLQVFYAATKPGFQIWAWLGFDGFSAQHGHWTPPVCFWSDFTALRYKVLKW